MSEIVYCKLKTEDEAKKGYALTAMKENNYWLGGGVTPPILMNSAKKGEVILAKDEDCVVGLLHYHCRRDGFCVIYHVCVHPNYRCKDIARSMILLAPPPYQSIVRLNNIPIQKLYEKLGMILVGEKKYLTKKKNQVHVLIYRSKDEEGLFDNC